MILQQKFKYACLGIQFYYIRNETEAMFFGSKNLHINGFCAVAVFKSDKDTQSARQKNPRF